VKGRCKLDACPVPAIQSVLKRGRLIGLGKGSTLMLRLLNSWG
jgi:hypothetical protein